MTTTRSFANNSITEDEEEEIEAKNQNETKDLLDSNFNKKKYSIEMQKIKVTTTKTKEDIAATVIQSAWRMFKYHHQFHLLFSHYKKLKQREFKPFLTIFLLNSQVGNERRLFLYKEMKKSLRLYSLLPFRYKLVSYDCFKLTDQLCIPQKMDADVLIAFVKKMMEPTMRNILYEWLIVTRKRKREEKEEFRLDRMSTIRFKLYYSVFMMWRRITAQKRFQKIPLSGQMECYDHYVNKKNMKEKKREQAANQKKTNLKRRALFAIRNNYIERTEYRESLRKADEDKIKRIMNNALLSWNKFIAQNKSQNHATSVILKSWYKIASIKHNLKILCNSFAARHNFYVKRHALSAFIKFRKANLMIRIYKRENMLKHKSLGLWFCWSLLGNDDEKSLCLALHAWSKYTKGRKAWNNFIFNNIKLSDYDVLKKKALSALRKQPIYIIPKMITNQQFKNESQVILNRSLDRNIKQQTFLLLDSSTNINEEITSRRRAVDVREYFM